MLDLTPQLLKDIRAGYQTIFNKAFMEGPEPSWKLLAEEKTSTHEIECYDIMLSFPGFRRFLSEIDIQNIKQSAQWKIANDLWHDVVGVKRMAIRRGQAANYNNMFEMLGMAARNHPDKLIAGVLEQSFTEKGFTGQAFISANQPFIPGSTAATFTNYLPNRLSPASYDAARLMLQTQKDPNGQTLALGGKLLLVCSSKWATLATQILKSPTVAQAVGTGGVAVSNIYNGTAEVLEFTYLNTPTMEDKWFLVRQGTPLKPFIVQTELKPTFSAQDKPDDDHVFKHEENLYKAFMSYGAGFGHPQLIVGSDGSQPPL